MPRLSLFRRSQAVRTRATPLPNQKLAAATALGGALGDHFLQRVAVSLHALHALLLLHRNVCPVAPAAQRHSAPPPSGKPFLSSAPSCHRQPRRQPRRRAPVPSPSLAPRAAGVDLGVQGCGDAVEGLAQGLQGGGVRDADAAVGAEGLPGHHRNLGTGGASAYRDERENRRKKRVYGREAMDSTGQRYAQAQVEERRPPGGQARWTCQVRRPRSACGVALERAGVLMCWYWVGGAVRVGGGW